MQKKANPLPKPKRSFVGISLQDGSENGRYKNRQPGPAAIKAAKPLLEKKKQS